MGASIFIAQSQQPGERVWTTDHTVDHRINRSLQLILIKGTAASHLPSGHGQTAENIVHGIPGRGNLIGKLYSFFIHIGLDHKPGAYMGG